MANEKIKMWLPALSPVLPIYGKLLIKEEIAVMSEADQAYSSMVQWDLCPTEEPGPSSGVAIKSPALVCVDVGQHWQFFQVFRQCQELKF